jgi:hypothetical protein
MDAEYCSAMVPLKPTLNAEEDYRSTLDQLSEGSKKLKKLRELHALKLANRCHRQELDQIKAQVKRTQDELMELMLKAENFTGEIIEPRCKLNFPT